MKNELNVLTFIFFFFFFCISSVACPVSRGAGQILRVGQERTTATHAALPRLVSTRQLCMFLGFQASSHTFRLEGVYWASVILQPAHFLPSRILESNGLLLCSVSSSGHVSSAGCERFAVEPMMHPWASAPQHSFSSAVDVLSHILVHSRLLSLVFQRFF